MHKVPPVRAGVVCVLFREGGNAALVVCCLGREAMLH